jgi:hypothetical protein
MWLNLLYGYGGNWSIRLRFIMSLLMSNKQTEMCVSGLNGNGNDVSSGLVGRIQKIRNPIKSCHLVME